jgi:hypothetical protein
MRFLSIRTNANEGHKHKINGKMMLQSEGTTTNVVAKNKNKCK